MIILFDQDDVLADFDGEFTTRWRARHPDRPWIPPERKTHFYAGEQYSKEFGTDPKDIYDILLEPGFILGLPPFPAGIAALHELADAGHDVYICTSPLNSDTCASEKLVWIERHIGFAFRRRTILTNDKTFVYGDILIDDKPAITGLLDPCWEHVLMDRPYNRHITDKPRIASDWSDWKNVLAPLLRP